MILNITYTTIAALAGSAGMCSMLVSTKSSGASSKPLFVCAVLLSFAASLIRIQIFALILCIALPAFVFIYHSLNPRKLIAALLFIGLLTASGYIFDKLYLRSSPDWNTYYQYNAVSQLIHDTNRLANAHRTIRNVGWSGNDQELFAHWFYSDPNIFSFAHLQYLVNNIPATTTDAAAVVSIFLTHLLDPPIVSYVLMLLSIWLFSLKTSSIPKSDLFNPGWSIGFHCGEFIFGLGLENCRPCHLIHPGLRCTNGHRHSVSLWLEHIPSSFRSTHKPIQEDRSISFAYVIPHCRRLAGRQPVVKDG